MTYVYKADTWCDSCGERLRAELTREGLAPEDPSDEWLYDSDAFPKGPVAEEATDGPDHCAAGVDCLEPVDLFDYGLTTSSVLHGAESTHIGALLSDGLTDEGIAYTLEMMASDDPTPYQSALYRLWRETFEELGEAEASALEDKARELGADHGRAAASWYFDGNTTAETYARVLQGLEDGDPAVLDTLPSSPLSGEYAGDPTPASLLADLGVDAETAEDWQVSELCDAYEDGFYMASQGAIEAAARAQLTSE